MSVRSEGERYREGLLALAEELGVGPNLILVNRFVSAEELVEHVGAADIYITPYRQEAQIVSGTLAIALGAGKAIISTPYWHAKELLAQGRGVIVPFENPDSIAEAVLHLLDNDGQRHAMRKRAYLHSRETIWQKTAQKYMASFQRARFERTLHPRAAQKNDIATDASDLSTSSESGSHVTFVGRYRNPFSTQSSAFPTPAKATPLTTMRVRSSFARCCMNCPKSRTNVYLPVSLTVTSLSYGSHSILSPGDSETFSATTVNGLKIQVQTTVMDAHCGHWELCSVDRATQA